jgi:hypothetical protein
MLFYKIIQRSFYMYFKFTSSDDGLMYFLAFSYAISSNINYDSVPTVPNVLKRSASPNEGGLFKEEKTSW